MIAWAQPTDRGSSIFEYEIAILTSDGVTFSEETKYCNGEDPAIVLKRSCLVPLNILI